MDGSIDHRRGEHPQRHLANFAGVLQADAFAGYAIYTSALRFAKQRAWRMHVKSYMICTLFGHDGVTEEQFVRMRETRDATLAMHVLMLPSVQVNIRADGFSPVEEKGQSYLKIPLNETRFSLRDSAAPIARVCAASASD
ncbi:hypothetical protein QF025_006627 [Paraburkholderia graminis]|uniref:Transposase IS66 central domain-containing protein n=1 Tax=Paraburkholderia graminis TaxID=60548 RepID=A0ABD5CU93_9BURK|nr:hypothetical protein [Paraburkholderia graminis]